MICVGIDPGTNTGFAVWDCIAGEFAALDTLGFWSAYQRVLQLAATHERLLAVVEDPSGNKPVFPRNLTMKEVKIKLHIAQSVGGNKREAQLLIKGLRRAGIPVKTVTPRDGKWNAETFAKITGYQGRTNEHKRDAGRLVVGMKPMPEAAWRRILRRQSQPAT